MYSKACRTSQILVKPSNDSQQLKQFHFYSFFSATLCVQTDLISATELDSVVTAIERVNATAIMKQCTFGSVDASDVLDTQSFRPDVCERSTVDMLRCCYFFHAMSRYGCRNY